MSQESWVERFSTDISGWVTSTDKLYSFKGNPLSISSPPKAVLFSELSEESYDSHCGIFISVRQVDLIAEYYEPLAWLFGSQDDTTDCFVVLTIVLELLHDEARVCR